MKRENGFTLIELLAIIVILAIIAVITVPIILNIIDNSKKGAAKDSAYGYKDAINKFYVSKLSGDKNYTIPNNSYTIANLKTMGVSASGKEPGTNSWITIENNNVVAGCLEFDEYKVEITNGEIGSATVGACPAMPGTIASCPGCVFTFTTAYWYYRGNNQTTLSDSSLYSSNYNDIMSQTGKDYFLGVILDGNNKIDRAFACAIHDNGTPYCIEAAADGSKYAANSELLNSEALWNGACNENYSSVIGTVLDCSGTTLGAHVYAGGNVHIDNGKGCYLYNDGQILCYQ